MIRCRNTTTGWLAVALVLNFSGATNNTLGGTATGAGNLISGNTGGAGVRIVGATTTGNTIAGNLIDLFKALSPANDLEFRFGTNAPTVRVEGLTVGGL